MTCLCHLGVGSSLQGRTVARHTSTVDTIRERVRLARANKCKRYRSATIAAIATVRASPGGDAWLADNCGSQWQQMQLDKRACSTLGAQVHHHKLDAT